MTIKKLSLLSSVAIAATGLIATGNSAEAAGLTGDFVFGPVVDVPNSMVGGFYASANVIDFVTHLPAGPTPGTPGVFAVGFTNPFAGIGPTSNGFSIDVGTTANITDLHFTSPLPDIQQTPVVDIPVANGDGEKLEGFLNTFVDSSGNDLGLRFDLKELQRTQSPPGCVLPGPNNNTCNSVIFNVSGHVVDYGEDMTFDTEDDKLTVAIFNFSSISTEVSDPQVDDLPFTPGASDKAFVTNTAAFIPDISGVVASTLASQYSGQLTLEPKPTPEPSSVLGVAAFLGAATLLRKKQIRK